MYLNNICLPLAYCWWDYNVYTMVFEQKQQMIVLFAFAAAFEVYGAGLMIKNDDRDDLLSIDYDTR